MKIYLISEALGGMGFVGMGAYIQSNSMIGFGGLLVLFSLILWISLGYAKPPTKNLLVLFLLNLTLFSCTKSDETMKQAKDPRSSYYNNPFPEPVFKPNPSTFKLTTMLTISPISSNQIYLNASDVDTWNMSNIEQQTYQAADNVTTYYYSSSTQANKYLMVLENTNTLEALKVNITGTPVEDGYTNWQYTSESGNTLYWSSDLKDSAGGFLSKNVVFNTNPPVEYLGEFIPNPDGVLVCKNGTGFSNCMQCSWDHCSASWTCAAACGLTGPLCLGGMATACIIKNTPPLGPGNYPITYFVPVIDPRGLVIDSTLIFHL